MQQKGYFKIGCITKTNGSQGELSVKFSNNLSENILNKMESIFINIDGILVPFFIKEFRRIKTFTAKIIFEDIDSLNLASEFLNKELYLSKKDFNEPLEKKEDIEVIGYTIFDKTFGKIIGTVNEVLNFKNNSVISLEIDGKEVLIPVADDIILEIDNNKKQITVVSPKGLLDIYTSN